MPAQEQNKPLCAKWKQREIRELQDMLTLQPENVHALVRLGRLYFDEIIDHPIAFDYLWQAQNIVTEGCVSRYDHSEVILAIADLHMLREEFSRARWKYKEVLTLDRSNAEALNGKHAAEAAMNAKKLREGIPVAIDPDADAVRRMLDGSHSKICQVKKKASRKAGEIQVEFIPK